MQSRQYKIYLHQIYCKSRKFAIIACSSLLLTAGGAAAQQQTVVFAGWGGSLQKAQREVFFNTFEEETGIRVIDATDVNYAKIKAMVTTGDVHWDVVQTLGMWTKPGEKDNLWEPLDYSTIDRAGVPDSFVGKYTIGNSQYALVLAYNKKTLGSTPAPQTWADFWDVKQFPGQRAWRQFSRYTTEAALMAAGVSTSDIYPINVDKTFKSLNQLKPNVNVWPRSAEQVIQMLSSGEIAMGMATHNRIIDAQNEGLPLAFSWKQGIMTVDNLAVPRGAKNKANAMKLINWMEKPETQAKLAKLTAVGPTNERALQFVSPELREKLPLVHLQKGELLRFNDDWWAENITMMDERLLEWSRTIK